MADSGQNTRAIPAPNGPLAAAGKAAIIVPLIIGGAIIAAAFLLWHSHSLKLRAAEAACAEEDMRRELRDAYRRLRAFDPQGSLDHIHAAAGHLAGMNISRNTDYMELKVALLMLEGEVLFITDAKTNAALAEKRFDEALAILPHASGEYWEFGVFGRARARLEQGKCGEAAGDLDRLLARNPNFGSAYYWRSQARKCHGDAEGSAADERRAKSLDSWPPLRDFMESSGRWMRDVLCDEDARKR